MEIKVRYKNGIFTPLQDIRGLAEGEEFEINIEREDFHLLAIAGAAFDFLNQEDELYSAADVVERYE